MNTKIWSKLTALATATGMLMFGGWLVWHYAGTPSPPVEGEPVMESAAVNNVVLNASQLRSVRLQFDSAQQRWLQSELTIPGRLRYNEESHVAVQSACAGVLLQTLVRPGESVQKGQVLAVVSSPEVGSVRSELQDRSNQLRLVKLQHERNLAIRTSVQDLANRISERQSPERIEEQVRQDALGMYFGSLMDAYSRLLLAQAMTANLGEATRQGAVSGRVLEQRKAELQAAEASLRGAMEQANFDSQLAVDRSAAALENAARQRDVSRQELQTLLGPGATEQADSLGKMDRRSTLPETEDDERLENTLGTATEPLSETGGSATLSHVRIVAPIAGSIEERLKSTSERVAVGDVLFVVADNSQLWAEASVRERHWSAISLEVGQSVTVRSPALPEQEFDASVVIVGRSVDAQTGAASLIAEMKSPDPRLRPGLFIYMTVPTGPQRSAVVVPQSAVVVHEDQHFVFTVNETANGSDLQDDETRDFQRVDVEVGETIGGFTEILSGVSEGDLVVSEGAFLLKSELLLAGESE